MIFQFIRCKYFFFGIGQLGNVNEDLLVTFIKKSLRIFLRSEAIEMSLIIKARFVRRFSNFDNLIKYLPPKRNSGNYFSQNRAFIVR